jgi:hypothetical protein
MILALSLAAIGYGYWGAFTRAGSKVYDEMDGFIPFFIMIGGLILFVTLLVILFIKKRKAKH